MEPLEDAPALAAGLLTDAMGGIGAGLVVSAVCYLALWAALFVTTVTALG